MKKIILLTAVSTALFSMSAAYAGGGSIFSGSSDSSSSAFGSLYGGASVGKTFADNCPEQNSGSNPFEAADYTCSRESDDIAWKVFGGYKLNKNFAIEGAYIDFGEYSMNKVYGSKNWNLNTSTAKGASLMGVASAPIADNFEVFGKLGVLHWEREMSDRHGTSSTKPSDYKPGHYHRDQGTDLAIGAGAQYKVTDNIAIRGEVEHFDDIDVNLMSLGASFSTL